MQSYDLLVLHQQLNQRLDLEELRTLCSYLGLDYDDLRGEGKAAKARELIKKAERDGQIERLMRHLDALGYTQESLGKRYVVYLKRQYGHIPLGGIAPRLQDRILHIPLKELFVPLQAESDAPLHTQFVVSSVQSLRAQRPSLANLAGLDEIFTAPQVVILGEPGAGKSTLLRWCVAQALEALQTQTTPPPLETLPIFLRLVRFAAVLEQNPGLGLAQYLRERHEPEFQAVFKLMLSGGRGLLLLDGLDEVADPQQRRLVRDAIETFVAQFPDFRIVVTCRITGYRSTQLSTVFHHFTLQPFGTEDVTLFLQNWYRAVSRQKGDMHEAEAEQRAIRLREGLEGRPRILQLAGTPLLLAIIALMDWKGKAIPKHRVELYEVATTTLLEDWPAEQGRPQHHELNLHEMWQVLSPLAYHMFESGFNEAIRRDELEKHVIRLLKQIRACSEAEARVQAQTWLPVLSEHSGLLLDSGVDEHYRPVYAFLHLSFVEYLSGRYLAERWRHEPLNLTRFVNDPRWREVILLMAGHIGTHSLDGATKLIKEIGNLAPPHHELLHQTLVLAAACLADDVQVASDLRTNILDQLISLWHRNTSGLLRSKLFRILAAMRDTESASEVVTRLLPLLHDGRLWVRTSVLELLSKLGYASDTALKAILLDALHDPQPEIRQAAVRSIETMALARDPDVLNKLLALLTDSDAGFRTRTVLALRIMVEQDERVIAALVQAMTQDESADVRQMAIRVLARVKLPGERLIATILSALKDNNSGVRKEAASTLAEWGQDSHQRLMAMLRQAVQQPDKQERRLMLDIVADVSAVLGQPAIDLLIEVAESDPDLWVRGRAVHALGHVSKADNRVIEVLVSALPSSNRVARQGAALGLKRLGVRHGFVTTALLATLENPDTQLRRYAADALARCGQQDAPTFARLESALTDADEFVRLNVAVALIRLGARLTRAQDHLVALLQSANVEVRRRAAQGLRGTIHRVEPPVIARLTELVTKGDSNVQEQALLALAELGHRAPPQVIDACRNALLDKSHWIRMRSAEALSKLGQTDEITITVLLRALTDKNARVRLAASEALIALGDAPERDLIVERVRNLFEEQPDVEDILNTLWGLVVGD